MRPRTHIHFVGEKDSAREGRHAPIAGDDYSPPLMERTRLIDSTPRPYREWSREEKQAYIEHLEAYDKPAYESPIQPQEIIFSTILSSTTKVGKSIGKIGKYAIKAVRSVATKAVKTINKEKFENKQLTVDRQQQAANARALRDSIDRHHDRMKDRQERAREQQGIDRREQRDRLGDTTMNA